MIETGRRGFIAGALALITAPTIVKVASLMPVKVMKPSDYIKLGGVEQVDVLYGSMPIRPDAVWLGIGQSKIMSVDEVMREGVRMFRNSNEFIRNLNAQYDEQFGKEGAEIGSQLRIRLPSDYDVGDWRSDYEFAKGEQWGKPASALALAVAAPVVVAKALEQPVTRRFWDLNKRKESNDV